jgi:hypothetical protein
MAQHDYILSNQSGAAFRSDLNNGLAAIVSNNSGVAQPSTTYAYQWWSDTTTGLLKLRNAANNAWITIGTLADANLGLLSLAGGTLTGALLVDDSGTAALPAIAFDGDPDTGAFRAGANEFGIATNGVERVEFGTSEVVFNDGGANYDFRIEGDTNASLFKIDAGLDQVQVANLNGGPLAGFRNRIINGNFDIAQRGTSISSGVSALTYTLDRWIVAANTAAVTASQGSQTSAPYSFLSVTGAAGNTGVSIRQRIEAKTIRDLAGQQVTLSFFIYNTTSNATSITVQMDRANTEDNFSAATQFFTATLPSVSDTARQSVTVTLPAEARNGVEVRFVANAITTGIFVLHTVQLEPGPVATPFEQRPIGTELALCQRYYETKIHLSTGAKYASTIGSWFAADVQYVSKRATPTITITASVLSNCTSPIVGNSNSDCAAISVSTSGAIQYTASSLTVTASAEL